MDYPKVIVVDCDGVLTDGTVYFTHTGERFKGFHTRDIRALRELVAHGYDVRIITASSWPGMKEFADRCGVDVIVARDKITSKPDEPYICIVDDIADLDMASGADFCFLPADADSQLCERVNPGHMLRAAGGRGVMAEVVLLLKSSHKWTS